MTSLATVFGFEGFDADERDEPRQLSAEPATNSNGNGHRRLTREEEVELGKRIEKGDLAAKAEMIVCNQRLVYHLLKGFKPRGAVTRQDLEQEGKQSLIRAAELFDWRKGYRFSTYAAPWIRNAFARCLDNEADMIRKPVEVSLRYRKIRDAEARLYQQLRREPTIQDVATETGLKVKRVAEIMFPAARSVNEEVHLGEHETATLQDVLMDGKSPAPFEDPGEGVAFRANRPSRRHARRAEAGSGHAAHTGRRIVTQRWEDFGVASTPPPPRKVRKWSVDPETLRRPEPESPGEVQRRLRAESLIARETR